MDLHPASNHYFLSLQRGSYQPIERFKNGFSYHFERVCMRSQLEICKRASFCNTAPRTSVY
jgi:hypothetical protein